MEIIINRTKEYWDDSFKKGKWDRLLNKEREKNTNFIADLIKKSGYGKSVLDIGAGNGALADLLLPGDFEYTGLDISSTALSSLNSRHKEAKTIQVDLNKLGDLELDAKFDFIVLNEVLYYVSPRIIFKSIKKFVKKDTKIIVSMYNSRRNYFIWFLTPFLKVENRYRVFDEERKMSWTIKVFSYEK